MMTMKWTWVVSIHDAGNQKSGSVVGYMDKLED